MEMARKGREGFTLIELLVVIAIIGILSTLAVVALNSARQRSRDAKRVSDIRQIQTALELGYSELNNYPVAATAKILGDTNDKVLCNNNTATPPVPAFVASAAGCGTAGTGTVYMGLVPSNPGPGGADYSYTSDGTKYQITFSLEGATGQLASGANCANQNGIIAGSSC
jgi:general secretion pathway protein G